MSYRQVFMLTWAVAVSSAAAVGLGCRSWDVWWWCFAAVQFICAVAGTTLLEEK